MNNRFFIIISGLCFVFLIKTNPLAAQVDSCKIVIEAISNAINNNATDSLFQYFNDKIELSVPGQTGINSRNHSQMILKEFFHDNQPTSFYIVTRNFSPQGVFIVGTLNTSKQRYRLSFLVRNNQKQQLIYQLSIEK
jgi:hypothetical protein